MKPDEYDRLLMVVFSGGLRSGGRFCFLEDTCTSLDNFLECLRILCFMNTESEAVGRGADQPGPTAEKAPPPQSLARVQAPDMVEQRTLAQQNEPQAQPQPTSPEKYGGRSGLPPPPPVVTTLEQVPAPRANSPRDGGDQPFAPPPRDASTAEVDADVDNMFEQVADQLPADFASTLKDEESEEEEYTTRM